MKPKSLKNSIKQKIESSYNAYVINFIAGIAAGTTVFLLTKLFENPTPLFCISLKFYLDYS